MAPQRHLKQAGFYPCSIHLLNVLSGVTFLSKKRLERKGHRKDEREEITKRDDFSGCSRIVRTVLLGAMMPQADLVLIVEPFLVVFRTGRVENPLAEPLAHAAQIITERLAVALAQEGLEQMGLGSDEPIPDVEDRLDLILHDIER